MRLKRNMATKKWLDLGTNSELTCMAVGGVWREKLDAGRGTAE